MTAFLLGLLVSCFCRATTADYSVTFLGAQEFSGSATANDGSVIAEISGITQYTNGEYYAVTDNLIDNKPIYDITVTETSSLYALSFEDSKIMTAAGDMDTDGMDSEGIAYITSADGYDWVVVSSEGHRTYDADNHLMVYKMSDSVATYVKDLDYLSVFDITSTGNGTQNNNGFEVLTTDPSYNYLIYGNEMPLAQDECDTCTRIVVNDLTVSGTDISIDPSYVLRYDTDAGWTGLADVLIINDDLDALMVERYAFGGTIRAKVYYANLQLSSNGNSSDGNSIDVMDCWSLNNVDNSDDCSANPIDKTLLFDFDTELTDYNDVNVESLALGEMRCDSDCQQSIFAISDNGGETDELTYVFFFELDWCEDTPVTCPAPILNPGACLYLTIAVLFVLTSFL